MHELDLAEIFFDFGSKKGTFCLLYCWIEIGVALEKLSILFILLFQFSGLKSIVSTSNKMSNILFLQRPLLMSVFASPFFNGILQNYYVKYIDAWILFSIDFWNVT